MLWLFRIYFRAVNEDSEYVRSLNVKQPVLELEPLKVGSTRFYPITKIPNARLKEKFKLSLISILIAFKAKVYSIL